MESEHPFTNSQFIEVDAPRGLCNLSFKPTTDISDWDSVTIYRDETRSVVWGKERYTIRELPGLNGNLPLIIPRKKFYVDFVKGERQKSADSSCAAPTIRGGKFKVQKIKFYSSQ